MELPGPAAPFVVDGVRLGQVVGHLLDRERVFDRLVRLDRARTGGGSGLGLAIARQLAQACGGTLVCRPAGSGSLRGAAFRLELPRASDPAARG